MSSTRPRKNVKQSAANAAKPIESRIMAGLTSALDWFDNSLQSVLGSLGFEPVHRTQSMIIMHIAMGLDSPSAIAREMGLTRQNVHHMAKSLIALGVIESAPDPADPRRSLYRLSDDASELRRVALETLGSLERVLEARLGSDGVLALRAALASDWGPEIKDHADLMANLPEPAPGARARRQQSRKEK